MLTAIVAFALFIFVFRLYSLLPRWNTRPLPSPVGNLTRSLAVFLGSGGHTSEALTLVSTLDFSRYTPRIYVISEGDFLSAEKVAALESNAVTAKISNNASDYTILTIPRARHVHQSLFTTPPTAFISVLIAIYYVTIAPLLFWTDSRPIFADVLILNGPGTCLSLCLAVYINKFIGLPAPRTLYVESFARVKSLSLSGKLLRPFVDRFIVQWPQLLRDKGRGECHNCLV